MTSHEEFYTQSPGSRTVSSSDYHAKCAGCAEKDQQIAYLTARIETSVGVDVWQMTVREFEKKIASLTAEREATGSAVDHVDLMIDEFKRIKSCPEVAQEIVGLCNRAIARTSQNVPVVVQRDDAQKQVSALQAKLEAVERERDEVYQGWKEMSELAASNFEELTAADEDVRALAGAMQKASEFLDEDDIRLPITGREIAAKSTLDSALARHYSVRTIVEGA